MMRWTDLAEWRGPTTNVGGPMVERRGMVVHIADGSYESAIGTCINSRGEKAVSSHFVVAGRGDAHDGQIAQVVDLDVTAETQQDGNGHWISVENSGFSPHPLTAAQVEANAQLYAGGMREFGWPAKLATSPADKGLAYHGLSCAGPGGDSRAPWTVQNTSGQKWGHCECPGAGVLAQLPAILARAIKINRPTRETMRYLFTNFADLTDEAKGRVHVTDGLRYRIMSKGNVWADLMNKAGAGDIVTVDGAVTDGTYANAVRTLCGMRDTETPTAGG